MTTSLPVRCTLEIRIVPAFKTVPLLMKVPWNLVVPAFLNQNFSRLHGAVEGLAGRRGGFVIFDEAGGGRGVRGEVGPSAGHAGSALQAVGDIGRAGVADEQAAAAVPLDGEVNVGLQNCAVVDERAVEICRAQ